MSREMSDGPESSNPFEKLSDDPILHIFSFLPGADLLKLSTMDKNFKRIITESTETMSKIPLVLDFEKNEPHKDLDLDCAIKLAQTRRFTALQLKSVNSLTDVNAKFKLGMLMKLLSGSIDDLTVWYDVSREFLSSIIAMFLPKLKRCKLLFAESAPILEGIGPQNSVNHPLQSLELSDIHGSNVLQLFTGCNQLKTFCYEEPAGGATTEDFDHVNNFLATQEHLEKLEFSSKGPAWNRLTCFKLKVLEAECLPGTDDQLAAAEFFKKLPKLAKLDITLVNHPSRRLMNAICRIPKLEKLTYRSWFNKNEHGYEDSLEGLVNHNVKELHITDGTGITPKLLKIFSGVDSVYLDLRTNKLDLSDVPYETFRKIKFSEDYYDYFDVKFSPSDIPTNLEQFESAVMEFATKFSKDISGIELGHVSWRISGTFRLSNSFCEGLVNQLPELVKLEVYNIADNGKFMTFLDDNQRRLKLKDVKLYKPFGVGEPEPKKMKIQVE